MVVEATREGDKVLIQGKEFPLTEVLELIFGDRRVVYFEAILNHGSLLLIRTVAPC